MKSIYLFCSKLWVYITEIPVLTLLWVAISLNSKSEDLFKYYPLIVFLSLSVIFIMVYFFRVISINTEEIRYHGLFSSRDSAFISENKSLVLSIKPHGNLGIELYGDAGSEPIFDWMSAEDVQHRDICLFRGRALGRKKTALKIMRYFYLPSDITDIDKDTPLRFDNEFVSIFSETKNEIIQITIKFKKTII